MSEPVAGVSPAGWGTPPAGGSSAGGPGAPGRSPPAIPDHGLLFPIGRGAYGEVWLARTVVGSARAVKIVHRRDFGDAQPFDREFKGIQRFEPVSRAHPGLVDILQVGRNDADGYFYYVMELADPAGDARPEDRDAQATPVAAATRSDAPETAETRIPDSAPVPGFDLRTPDSYEPRTLRQELRTRGRLPFQECVRIGLALAGGLEHLHRQGLVHRDIKPSNIIFVKGQPKLADIGLVADAGDSQSIVGTEGYLAPEGPGAPPADLFSLGKVLYEMSTGQDRRQFPDLPAELKEWPDARQVLELNEVVLKACARDATRRYPTAEALRADLERLQAGRSMRWRRTLEHSRRRAWQLAPVLAAGVVALLAFSRLNRPPAPAPAAPGLPAERASVFVLPFRPEGTQAVPGDLRSRITDAFIDALGSLEGVRRSPRRSAWVYLDEDEVRRALARTNDLRHILSGRVGGGVGGELTLTLQLHERGKDQPVWAGRFTGRTNAVPDLERRAFVGMAKSLGLTLTAAEQQRIEQKFVRNLEALLLLRKAGEIYEQQAGTQAGHERIQSLAQQALELDPGYLNADFLDAVIHRDLSLSKSSREQWPNLQVRLRNILRQDETHGGALDHLGGYLLVFARDWDALRANIERELAVGDPKWREFAGAMWYRTLGWLEEARVRQELEDRLGNTGWGALFHRAAARRVERRYAEAVQVSRQLVALHPGIAWGYLSLAHSLVANGEFEAAVKVIQQRPGTLHDMELTALKAYAYAKMGRSSEARAVLAELVERGRAQYLQPYHVARVHAALGDHPQALDWLEKAEADKSEFLMFADVGGLRTDPAWDGLQAEPRYWELCDRLGLGRNQWPRPKPDRQP